MALSDLSIRRPVFAWMLMVGLIVFGGLAFMRLGVSQLPDVDFPVITVQVHLDGAPPEVMEQDVVDVLEDKVMSIEGVKTVTSQARNSYATVKVEFDLSRNIDIALQDVQAKISQAQKLLPTDIDAPTISKTNPDDMPIIYLSVEAPNYKAQDLMMYVRDELKNKFATVPGVGDIVLGGYLDPNMRIWVKDKELNRYQLAVSDLISNLTNEHVDPPTGQVDQGRKEFNLRFYGEAASPEQFAKIRLNYRGGQPNYNPITLGQVARIEESTADVTTMARAMGAPAISVAVLKQRGSNAVAVARGVRAKVKELAKIMPEGMRIGINFDSSKYVEEAVSDLNFTLLLSALLTGIVCWMFLGSWSSTFNVLLAIPTSIIGAFSILYWFGFTLNTFTLLALSLAIGIVVDDAIMVLENIVRHQEMGKGRVQAALDGSREITFAAAAASISVIAIFLPVAFMSGIIGKFFFQFGVTMTIAVLISLLEALTLSPMRAASMGGEIVHGRPTKIGRMFEAGIDWVTRGYAKTLEICLGHKWTVIITATVLCVASFMLVKKLRQEFLPTEDQSRFIINVQTPVGSSITFTSAKIKEVEAWVVKRPEVERYFAIMGSTGGNGDLNSGRVVVTMKDPGKRGIDPVAKRELKQQDLMGLARNDLRKNIKDVKIVVQDLSMRGLTTSRGFPVEFTVLGRDWEKLAEYVNQMTDEMGKSGLMTDLDTDYLVGMPEIQIVPDRDRASARGVVLKVVGEAINAMIGGQKIGQYPFHGHRYDVRIKLEDDGRSQLDRIKGLFVRNNRGELIALSELVKVENRATVQAVARLNRERAITVFANVKQGESQKKALEYVQELEKKMLPTGYHVVFSGSSQTFQESFQSLGFALIFGIFVAYMVLATQFNSFIDPITVLVALPFSVTGAFVSLWMSGQSLNIYSMIGLILLMGIAKKNSILLVDFTNQVRDGGEKSIVKALVHACPIRLRPILMTSIATVAGAIPPALALGPGAESRVPMAITVIGGVLISTIFTLYLVPCVYVLLSRFENRESLLEQEGLVMDSDGNVSRLDGKPNEPRGAHGHSGKPGGDGLPVGALPVV